MKTKGFLFTVMLAALTVPVLAQRTPRINRRQENQQDRIQQGVKSGELTRGEARRLEEEQGKIEADKLIAQSDGNVSAKERARLNRELNKASRDIYRAKHNNRERDPK